MRTTRRWRRRRAYGIRKLRVVLHCAERPECRSLGVRHSGQAGDVQALVTAIAPQNAQVAAPEPQQVDHLARPRALIRFWPTAPAVEQRQQPLLRCAMATFCVQSLEDGLADQTLLTLPHVLLGLSLDEACSTNCSG